MFIFSIAYNVGKINKKTFRKSIAMYNIILYNNYSNKIQIKGDLQMLNNENIIKTNNRIIARNEKEIEVLLEQLEGVSQKLRDLYKQKFELIEANEELEGEE